MLDAVTDYLPSPLDISAGQRTDPDDQADHYAHADDSEPITALAFKVAADPFVGN